jgi:hypothetical protein
VVIHLRAKPIRLAIGRHALGNQKRLFPEKHSFPGIGKIITRQQTPFILQRCWAWRSIRHLVVVLFNEQRDSRFFRE